MLVDATHLQLIRRLRNYTGRRPATCSIKFTMAAWKARTGWKS